MICENGPPAAIVPTTYNIVIYIKLHVKTDHLL